MRRSTDRILTTHVGALQRPAELSKAMAAHGQWSPDVLDLLRASVTEVVRRQAATGSDVVDDGWAKLAVLAEGAALASSRIWKGEPGKSPSSPRC